MNLLDYTLDEFKNFLKEEDIPGFRATQVFKGIYSGQNVEEILNIPKSLREFLKENFVIGVPEVIKNLISKDGTEKFLLRFHDGNVVEAALMKYSYGNTICISSQIGCRMGCKFCASCVNGLTRNLTTGEMIGEILSVKKFTKQNINKIVIMGSGEPLDNFDNIVKFIDISNKEYSLNLGQRNITLSTCGIVPKIYELAEKNFSINLAISLHASYDAQRIEMMEIAKSFKINEILEAVKYYFKKTGRRVTFEYALIDSINDTKEDANRLCELLKNIVCHVNVIPINKVAHVSFERPDVKRINKFIDILTKNGINVTKRRELGKDIEASCGQLKNSYFAKF